MKNRIFAASMALALSFMTVSPALAAPVLGFPASAASVGNTAAGNGKTIKFTVRNNSDSPITIQAGDQQYTVAPGKESKLKAFDGTQLTAVNSTAKHAAGDLLGTVNSTLGGNTLVIN